jgi:hypothetical protein
MIPDITPAIMGVPEDFDVWLSGCVASSPVPGFAAYVGLFFPFTTTLDPFPFVGITDPVGGTIIIDVCTIPFDVIVTGTGTRPSGAPETSRSPGSETPIDCISG